MLDEGYSIPTEKTSDVILVRLHVNLMVFVPARVPTWVGLG